MKEINKKGKSRVKTRNEEVRDKARKKRETEPERGRRRKFRSLIHP